LRKAKLTFFKLEEGDNLGVGLLFVSQSVFGSFKMIRFLFLCRV
jgi:hypothetical protein